MSRGRFCHTLDVLTDGSEHTGSGSLFLSVWKIPLSVRTANTGLADESDSSCSSESSESSESDSDDDREASDAVSDSIENESKNEKEKNENEEKEKEEEKEKDHVPPNASHDPHPWLTGSDVNDENENDNDGSRSIPVPVARYALSGVGDATARLCADQRFKLAPTRACFVPALGTDFSTADGLSALLLALFGAGSPSLHVVVPAVFARCGNDGTGCGHRSGGDNDGRGGGVGDGDGGGAFVEELAAITLGAHKRFDIRTCEVRPSRDDSATWWKVYRDEYLLVHASTCEGLSPALSLSRAESSIVYLYSFPSPRGQSGTPRETWCTLGLLPPGCANAAGDFERLVRRDLPMIRDGLPMACIDYVIVLDPELPSTRSASVAQRLSGDGESADDNNNNNNNNNGSLSRLAKRNRVLATLPVHRGRLGESAVLDEGILMRSQQLHRQLHRRMPEAFVEPKTTDTTPGEGSGTDRWIRLRSGTSLFLEPIGNDSRQSKAAPSAWDRRNAIRNKELKEEWTRESVESLGSFLGEGLPLTDENQINPDGETGRSKTDYLRTDEIENEIEPEDNTEADKPDSTADENEIDLGDDEEIEKSDLTADENEIDFDDNNSNDVDKKKEEQDLMGDENEIDLDDNDNDNDNNINDNDNEVKKEKPDLMGDENEIDLDDDDSNDEDDDNVDDEDEDEDEDDKEEKPDLMGDENEIDLDDNDDNDNDNDNDDDDDDDDEDKKAKTNLMEDENEIDLEDDSESDMADDNEVKDETAKNSKRIDSGGKNDASKQKDCGKDRLPSRIETTDESPGLRDRQCAASGGPGPRLLVLGTGCATPSAYRGASGYALVLPSPDEPEPRRGMRVPRHQRCRVGEQQQPGDRDRDPSSRDTATTTECNDRIYILDCGEGVSTMLSRNCGRVKDWATRVRGIWISHAHLDHYGGLPTLLRILWRQRERQRQRQWEQQHQFHSRGRGGTADGDSRYRPKRQKMSPPPPPASVPVPWVVAPAKVLRYLDLVLDCRYGHRRNGTPGSRTAFRSSSNDNDTACFEPRLHHDPRIPSGPWFVFENVKVHHNCCPAFGLLIGWDGTTEPRTGGARATQPQSQHRRSQSQNQNRNQRRGRSRSPSLLCYSGDTRPSSSLVRACKRALRRSHPTADLFLIHEATYRDAESSMAAAKKHSTLSEARAVAAGTGCSRVLLSHFSQRYDAAVSKPAGNENKFENETENKTENETESNGEDATELPRGDPAGDPNGLGNPSMTGGGRSAADVSTGPEPEVGLAADGLWIRLDGWIDSIDSEPA